jgi:hypothetical protein
MSDFAGLRQEEYRNHFQTPATGIRGLGPKEHNGDFVLQLQRRIIQYDLVPITIVPSWYQRQNTTRAASVAMIRVRQSLDMASFCIGDQSGMTESP